MELHERIPVLSRNPWENEVFATESLESIDRQFLPGTKQEVEFIEKELDLSAGSSILDLGCGAGRHSIELAQHGFHVTGIDISEKMLEEAGKRAFDRETSVDFIRCDLLSLSNHFNDRDVLFEGAICICESGLGSPGWEKDLKLLRNIHGLLSNNAKMILTTYNGLRKYRGDRVNTKCFDFLTGTVHWKVPDDWHGNEKLCEDQRVYIPSEMKILFEIAGFTEIEILGCKPGDFKRNKLEPDDIEMMVIGTK